jgi:hypothetical protein
LSRREQRLGGGLDLSVMKKERMQHSAILTRWQRQPGLPCQSRADRLRKGRDRRERRQPAKAARCAVADVAGAGKED